MADIILSTGEISVIDDQDFDLVGHKSWLCMRSGRNRYAVRTEYPEKRKITVPMHRLIMGLTPGDKRVVDHINRNGLDNRRSNLRIVTHQQNSWNCRKRNNATSGYYGVCRYPSKRSPWQVKVRGLDGKLRHVGVFKTELEAAHAYDKAIRAIRGTEAVTNFPLREAA